VGSMKMPVGFARTMRLRIGHCSVASVWVCWSENPPGWVWRWSAIRRRSIMVFCSRSWQPMPQS